MPLSQSKLLVRVDVGIEKGTEGVRGVHALAREFRHCGGQAVIVCNDIPNVLRRRIEQDCIAVRQTGCAPGSVDDCFAVQEIIALERPDWLAIDGAAFDANYIDQISKSTKHLSILDGNPRGQAHLVVGDAAAEADGGKSHYDSISFSTRPKLLTGPAFSLVERLNAQPLNQKVVAEAKKILVWIDGADLDNWTLKTLQSLSDQATKRMTVDCVVGHQYAHFAELENFKRYSNVTLRIHKNQDRIEPLTERADLAIASGHRGCYSLAYFGIPTILITTPESNANIVSALHQKRAVFSIAHETNPETGHSPKLGKTIKKLISDRFKRGLLSRHAMDCVDGLGSKRVVSHLASLSISLRPAIDSDCELIWQWRNDPEVRSVALDQQPIAWSDHTGWFDESQADDKRQIFIAKNTAGHSIGHIEFQFDEGGNQVRLSLIVDQKHRGRGTGVSLIKIALERIFATTEINKVVAQMRSGNTASEKSFRTAGFRTIAPTIVDGVMARQFLFERNQADDQPSRATKAA